MMSRRLVASRVPLFALDVVPLALFRLLVAGVPSETAGWHTSGTLPGVASYHRYAGKFCYDYAEGRKEVGYFKFTIQGNVIEEAHAPDQADGRMYLMAFDDETDHWETVRARWGDITCEEMMSHASFKYPLSPLNRQLNRTVQITESVRPRFWHFVFAACDVAQSSDVAYAIHAENTLQGMLSEFSLDQKGCVGLQLGATILFLTTAYLLRLAAIRATGAEAMRSRPLARLLLGSATLSGGGASCLALHYTVYMVNGEGLLIMEVLGQCLVCCAKALLTVLMLLTAKGWALFYAPEELVRRQLMMCILGGIIIISLACEIHADYFRDWSTTLYLYESGPGATILGLNLLLYMEAWRSMVETYRYETSEEVRVFYILVFVACSMYFLSLPLICLLALLFDPWVRFYYVAMVEVTARFASTLILAICLRPTRLDAMVNARLEDGLGTVGEMRDDISDEEATEDDENGYFLRSGRKGDGTRYDRTDLSPAE